MGLDMDFYKVNTNGEKEHLHYFRKHSDLHGVIQECWLEKNPDMDGEDFNCVEFEITMNEVDRINDFMANRHTNKHYTGFFWGQSNEEDWKETIPVLEEISDLLSKNQKVVYTSWW